MSFPSAFQIASDHRYVDFYIIDAVRHGHSYSTTDFFYIVRSPHIYHRYGDGCPHIYVDLGTGSPILYSHGDPIHIERGPQTYEGVPISIIDMGMRVPISMYIWGRGPRISIVLGTWGPQNRGSPYSHDTRNAVHHAPGRETAWPVTSGDECHWPTIIKSPILHL